MPVRLLRSRWLPWLLLAVLGLWLAWPRPTPAPALPPAPAPVQEVAALPSAPEPLAKSPPLQARETRPQDAARLPGFLPKEARDTIALIQRGGPFPYRQDGVVFQNREGHLPRKPRGWYHEYTVDTPGLDHRGTRRIITGGDPPEAWYYTDDHYGSFRQFSPGTFSPQGATP